MCGRENGETKCNYSVKSGKLMDTHGNGLPIKMASDKVVNLVLGFGVKVLEFMHRTVEVITYVPQSCDRLVM